MPAGSRYSDDRLDDRFREIDNFRIALSRLPDTMARLATEVENQTKRLDEVATQCRATDRKLDEREEARQVREAAAEIAARGRRVMVAVACGTGLLTIIVTIAASLLGLIGHA